MLHSYLVVQLGENNCHSFQKMVVVHSCSYQNLVGGEGGDSLTCMILLRIGVVEAVVRCSLETVMSRTLEQVVSYNLEEVEVVGNCHALTDYPDLVVEGVDIRLGDEQSANFAPERSSLLVRRSRHWLFQNVEVVVYLELMSSRVVH
jgi:hypothetical protein